MSGGALAVRGDDEEVVAVGERLEVAVHHLLNRVRSVAVEVEDDGNGASPVVAAGT